MRVSVVIPAYNAAATLDATLASLRNQTHAEWEAIVVDDGSTDATPGVADRHAVADPRIRVIRQANGGEAAARNSGIGKAGHDWLLFLDADDWIAADHLATMTAALAADPSLDAVHCRWARVAADGTMVTEDYVAPAGDMFDTWATRSAFPVHACVVRRALVDAVGRFDTSFVKSADWDLWQRIARAGARFGAVHQVLAFYRMRPDAASLDADQLLRDGLRVLQTGHGPDPRVAHPAAAHAGGRSPETLDAQRFYLLTWCAGLLLGRGQDATPLLDRVRGRRCPELAPDAIGRILCDSAPLPECGTPADWPTLYPRIERAIGQFLDALERASARPGLAPSAHDHLFVEIVRRSPWARALAVHEPELRRLREQAEADARRQVEHAAAVSAYEDRIREYERRVDAHERRRDDYERRIDENARRISEYEGRLAEYDPRIAAYETRIAEHGNVVAAYEGRITDYAGRITEYEARVTQYEARVTEYEARIAQGEARIAECEARLFRPTGTGRPTLSPARRALALLLPPARSVVQWLVNARLRVERLTTAADQRVMATVCSNFPIYSQTFVHQELDALATAGHRVRVAYSTNDGRTGLGGRFTALWSGRRRLLIDHAMHRRDLEHYRGRMPERVGELLDAVAHASGMSVGEVAAHDNVLQAFTFTRMVEAHRPAYLHSYFFYDRSLMCLVAGYLLGIPRGISCYADHLLDDYDLKLVPLHLALCDVVVATSARIRDELIAIAPTVDAGKIIVKPNGIDCTRFPVAERADPAPGEPFRLVTVCRIEPKKGLIDLVEAVAALRARGIPVEAHIVGEADEWSEASRDYKHALDQRISDLDLWGTVHLEGRQDLDGILRFQRIAHLFVAPFVETATGDKDGIPTALLEAMATGLPSVATDAGSIPEVITSGRDGVIVPQRDPAALADAIGALLADPAQRGVIGAGAAHTARSRFDITVCEPLLHRQVRDAIARAAHSAGRTALPRVAPLPPPRDPVPTEPALPPDQPVDLGDLRRLTPVGRNWGFERGRPVDRHYIEQFLEERSADIRGRVLEIEDSMYTRRFGGEAVEVADILHVTEGNPRATIVGNLTTADHIPSDTFDCAVITQTLHLIYDTSAAIRTLHRILKPGGVLLATFPGLSRTSHDEWEGSWYWGFTRASANRMFGGVFGTGVDVVAHGNVLSSIAFLHGLAAEDLSRAELDARDPDYDLLITVRAVKGTA